MLTWEGILKITAWSAFLPRPAYRYVVKHAYDLAGYDITDRGYIDLDPLGLEFVRTVTVRYRMNGLEYKIIEPDDLSVLGVGRHPTGDELL